MTGIIEELDIRVAVTQLVHEWPVRQGMDDLFSRIKWQPAEKSHLPPTRQCAMQKTGNPVRALRIPIRRHGSE